MIAIFRHGETIANQEDNLLGWTDSALTLNGLDQANKTAGHFAKSIGVTVFESIRLYFSSLGRSVISANVLMDYISGCALTKCDSLKERNYGEYEGQKRPRELDDPFGMRYCPDSESLADVYERVSRLLDREQVRYDKPDHLTIFHVHFNVSKILRGIFLQLSTPNWINFIHEQDTYYVINGRHCQEVKADVCNR